MVLLGYVSELIILGRYSLVWKMCSRFRASFISRKVSWVIVLNNSSVSGFWLFFLQGHQWCPVSFACLPSHSLSFSAFSLVFLSFRLLFSWFSSGPLLSFHYSLSSPGFLCNLGFLSDTILSFSSLSFLTSANSHFIPSCLLACLFYVFLGFTFLIRGWFFICSNACLRISGLVCSVVLQFSSTSCLSVQWEGDTFYQQKRFYSHFLIFCYSFVWVWPACIYSCSSCGQDLVWECPLLFLSCMVVEEWEG